MLMLNKDLEKIQYKEIVEMKVFKSTPFWLPIIVSSRFIGAYRQMFMEKLPTSKIVKTVGRFLLN